MPETQVPDRFGEALGRMEALCDFSGGEAGFWFQFLAVAAGICGARMGGVLKRGAGMDGEDGWETVVEWPGSAAGSLPGEAEAFRKEAAALAPTALMRRVAGGKVNVEGWVTVGVSVRTEMDESEATLTEEPAGGMRSDGEVAVVVALQVAGRSEGLVVEAVRRLRLLGPLPRLYRWRQLAHHSETAVGHFAAVLDLVSGLNVHGHFLPVAMTLCNEVATRHHCQRVSLGWLEKGYVRAVAISHSDRFERKMEAIQALERVMEEALDQDDVVVWPEVAGARMVTRAHANFSDQAKVPALCSVPLRLDGEPVAVLVCERAEEPFAEVEVRLLALYGEVSIRRLAELKKSDRWFGARWLAEAEEISGKLFGPRHALAKLIGATVLLGIPILALVKIDYRIDAPFSLRTEDVSYLSAPFNGFIDEVKVDVGDEVKTGSTLVTLDTRDLLLEEAAVAAERTRYVGEAERATGADKPSEARIVQAQADQAKARLEMLQYRRAQATIVSPLDGIVLEGDLKKRIGAPVKQGEVLLRVGRSDGVYVECEVNERDLRELQTGAQGEIAFAGAPKQRFAVKVTRIEPTAQVKDSGNIFLTRAVLVSPVEAWWRPGLSGVAKLHVARRSVLWVLLHRTIDFWKMRLWW